MTAHKVLNNVLINKKKELSLETEQLKHDVEVKFDKKKFRSRASGFVNEEH